MQVVEDGVVANGPVPVYASRTSLYNLAATVTQHAL